MTSEKRKRVKRAYKKDRKNMQEGWGSIHIPKADDLGVFTVTPLFLLLIAPGDPFLFASVVPVDVAREAGFVTRKVDLAMRSFPAAVEEFAAGSLADGDVCFAAELDPAGGADLVTRSSGSMPSITLFRSHSTS